VKVSDLSAPALRVTNRSTIIVCSAINVRQGAENEGA
jgi:hypothetical protein